jgi:phosphatidylethanolamine-binding protein (PEBP) family uncharacterized protein
MRPSLNQNCPLRIRLRYQLNVDELHMMPDLIAGSDNHELVTPGRGHIIQSGEMFVICSQWPGIPY